MAKTRFERELGNLESSLNFTRKFNIQKDDHILDIGCNYGSLLYNYYIEGFHNIQGLDVAKDRILTGKDTYPEIADFIQFYEGEKLPFSDNSFDFIFMFDVIEHIPNVENFLKNEVFRVLKPNGTFIFQTPNKYINIPWEIIHCKSFTAYKRFHCSLQSYHSLIQLLERSGFSNTKIEKFNIITPANKKLAYKYFWIFGYLMLYTLQELPLKFTSNFWGSCKK